MIDKSTTNLVRADLSIIIVNWNTGNLLAECIQTIQTASQSGEISQAEILVVDNASTDDSADRAKVIFPFIQLIRNSENVGFARANNQAAAVAAGSLLLFLNPDTLLQPGALQIMVEYLQSHAKIGMVGPKLLNPDGSLQLSIYRQPTLSREAWRLFHLDLIYPYNQYPDRVLYATTAQEVDVLQGTCVLVRKSFFNQASGFDEQFYIYSEEVDLCVRLREMGWKLHWLPDAEIIHFGAQSTRQNADEMFLMLYKNKIAFFRKHYGQPETGLYKLLLYLVSISRILAGKMTTSIFRKNHDTWQNLTRQYQQMLHHLASF